ncbi:MAG: benzoyl-CoA 2,3-epoxidase subunit BoxB [Proteobacteria bacterium]|nr:benzoyl-CoA 2,3-epoxidase subunit BoxB [Pseudomonadota bacterium]MCP4916569.1 benzoyl-CoA 2,3-epoxidase subunit BoxB [Pseudomonadota bacterium]
MLDVDRQERIPNNVDLSSDWRLRRALESWQPKFLDWWKTQGPAHFGRNEIYLRTAVNPRATDWARYGHVRMPEYRWGIFLAPAEKGRTISCGDDAGKPVWHEVPGDRRNLIRRLIVTQADCEPASVEQQRQLGASAPSLYDLRSLCQINVEEARHLWSMVYLLHRYFGRDGREEAHDLLARQSGHEETPRLLDAFNQPCADWLSFFCFTCFTDRDAAFQLGALAESGFDPLSRTARFMLQEEAYHLSVGERGIERILRRSAQLTRLDPNGDARAQGGIDLPTLQKYINHWFAYCVDLFGSEVSSNAALYFAAGLKGRWDEALRYDDHVAVKTTVGVAHIENDAIVGREVPLRMAMNELLRRDYAADCRRVVGQWNDALAHEGSDFRIKLPHLRFYRRQGLYSGHYFDPDGHVISRCEWKRRRNDWLPTDADRAFVQQLMVPCLEPGQMANWIAAPSRGIGDAGIDFEYVRIP